MPTTVCFSCRLRLFAQIVPKQRRLKSVRSIASLPTTKARRTFSVAAQRRQDERHDIDSGARTSDGDILEQRWTPHRLPDPVAGDANDILASEGVHNPLDAAAERVVPLADLLDDLQDTQETQGSDTEPSAEYVAQAARQAFGDRLPEGALNEEQYRVYERLYGPPLREDTGHEDLEDADTRDVLYREGEDGELEEIGVLEPSLDLVEDTSGLDAIGEQQESDTPDSGSFSAADAQVQRDIAAAMAAGSGSDTDLTIRSPDDLIPLVEEEYVDDEADEIYTEPGQDNRAHPFTAASRFGTSPSTVPLPRSSFVDPVAHLLSNISNKHLDETAHRIFGGPSIPYSPSTPFSSRTKPQKPIPLTASQGKMTEIEADVYMAAVMPQTYASVMGVIVETRKRLGAAWLENLLRRDGGPRILDAGASGAGVIAWREVLKAEWKRMHDLGEASPGETSSASDQKPARDIPPTPLGKATVLTGSNALRLRASTLLENTTFLPRLPDYVHASFPSEDSQRKQFDIIVAPHSLWHLQENYERHQMIRNLWSFLDPSGGVLVLLEKGVPRGFEVIADARAYILAELFERKEGAADDLSDIPKETASAEEASAEEAPAESTSEPPQSRRSSRRSPAHIVAPCPHPQKCPLYLIPGVSRQRKDYCHFKQRYVRPPYLQRLVGAKDRNFDDVEFSYVSIQKGVNDPAVLQGIAADDRAFQGYDVEDPDVQQPPQKVPHLFGVQYVDQPPRISNPLPRLLLPALKRQGHIHLDMCTPAGTFSRWTVPRSYGKQTYRDARKAAWGDLWALGGKQKEDRRVRLGLKGMEAGLGTGRGIDSKSKLKAKAAGPIKDVAGRSMPTVPGAAQRQGANAGDEDEMSTRDARIQRRRAAKNRGREKARSRRREETKALFKGIEV